jgi:hypothetical protein
MFSAILGIGKNPFALLPFKFLILLSSDFSHLIQNMQGLGIAAPCGLTHFLRIQRESSNIRSQYHSSALNGLLPRAVPSKGEGGMLPP